MLAEKSICTGCGACAASCPLNCIEMRTDPEGFRYPLIDVACCVSCRKCESVCPVLNKQILKGEPQAYGVKHIDENIRKGSSSGGVFPALASFVLTNGGAVCGAGYTDNFEVEHKIVEDASDICKLQGAKYAQSRAEHLFPEIRSILEANRWMLFVGTPCQVAGLMSYLGKDYDKLILVDMICHGVPSPLVWQKYLSYRKKTDSKNARIVYINQRDKGSGWSKYRYSLRIDYSDGKTYCAPQSEDPYMRGFVNNLYLRPSCAQCRFKGLERCSDLTLGDFWGVWEQHPEFDDNKGTSLVMVNTEKGASCWKNIKGNMDVIAVDARAALRQNPSAYNSSAPHPKRDAFFDKMGSADFDKLVSELLFGTPEKRYSLRNILRKIKSLK